MKKNCHNFPPFTTNVDSWLGLTDPKSVSYLRLKDFVNYNKICQHIWAMQLGRIFETKTGSSLFDESLEGDSFSLYLAL